MSLITQEFCEKTDFFIIANTFVLFLLFTNLFFLFLFVLGNLIFSQSLSCPNKSIYFWELCSIVALFSSDFYRDKGFFHFQVNSIQLLLSSSNSRYFEHPPIYCCFNLDTNSGRVKNTHRSLRFIQGHSPKVCFHSRPSVCIFPKFLLFYPRGT